MPAVILPGTYVRVNDEGLITAGRVATGNIGITGTASAGPLNQVMLLGSFSEAREIFGEKGDWDADNPNANLTLVRALEQIFNNGGSTVYAVRTSQGIEPDARSASIVLKDGAGDDLVELVIKEKGSAGNGFEIEVTDAGSDKKVELLDDQSVVQETYTVNSAADLIIQIAGAATTEMSVNLIGSDDSLPPANVATNFAGGVDSGLARQAEALVKDNASTDLVKITALTPGKWGNDLSLSIADEGSDKKVTIAYQSKEESYIVSDAGDLETLINANSSLVSAEPIASGTPDTSDGFSGGTNGAEATAADYAKSLEKLENEIINIVLLAGQDAAHSGMRSALEAHINITATMQRERIGIIGCGMGTPTSVASIVAEASAISSDRLVLVAPGIYVSNREVLSGGYMAAAVAGLMASLPVQSSLTNKVLTIPGLEVEFNRPSLEKLVLENVLAVEKREGYRIVKGITTATNSAWHQITTRRIVDYAIYGVRSACNPYIGKLNNERVRAAMKATLDAFLTRMVDDEALISYELEVTATRAQQIAGEAIVTMVLRPTFSIDFVKVTMYLE